MSWKRVFGKSKTDSALQPSRRNTQNESTSMEVGGSVVSERQYTPQQEGSMNENSSVTGARRTGKGHQNNLQDEGQVHNENHRPNPEECEAASPSTIPHDSSQPTAQISPSSHSNKSSSDRDKSVAPDRQPTSSPKIAPTPPGSEDKQSNVTGETLVKPIDDPPSHSNDPRDMVTAHPSLSNENNHTYLAGGEGVSLVTKPNAAPYDAPGCEETLQNASEGEISLSSKEIAPLTNTFVKAEQYHSQTNEINGACVNEGEGVELKGAPLLPANDLTKAEDVSSITQDDKKFQADSQHYTVTKEEKDKQKALKEKTAFIEGGKKGSRGLFSWTKRQEKADDKNSDSIQKRLLRLASGSKAVSLGIDDLSDDQVIIAVMGPTGAGKSSFIASVTGGDVRIGHDLQSCTTEIKIVKYECPDKSDFDVVFVDTPGFDDTERTDVEILEMIADWLNKTYGRGIMLAGILYFHRISDNRMAGTPLKNLRMFRELCGKNALQNIILTTTMWDEVDGEVGEARETELRLKYWKAMIEQGSATARFHGTQESAWDIVDHFVRDSNARHAVLLQKEMKDMQKQLPETHAGQKLYTELEVLVHKQQATLKKIREETKEHADPIILDALKAEYDGLRTQLAVVMNDMENMKLPLGKRILRLIWGPMFGPK